MALIRMRERRRGPYRPPASAERMIETGSRIALICLFLFAFFLILSEAMFFFAPLFAALIIALTLGPIASRLELLGLPATVAAALLLLAILLLIAGIVTALYVPLSAWLERGPEIWKKVEEMLASVREQLRSVSEAREDLEDALGEGGATVKMSDRMESFTSALTLAPAVAGQLLIFVGTFYFFLVTRHDLRRAALSFCMSRGLRCRVARIFRDVEADVSSYLVTIAIINAGFGACVAVALALLGVPSAPLWGLLAAVLNFAPYLGPAVMTMILFLVGLVSFEPISSAFVVAGVFVAMNVMEGQFVTPSFVGRTMTLNPFMVFVTLTFWLWLWGAIGAFLAVPLLLIGRSTVAHLIPRRREPRGADRPRKRGLPAAA